MCVSLDKSSSMSEQKEFKAIVAKCDALSFELSEEKARVNLKEDTINDFKSQIESLRAENALIESSNTELKEKIAELDAKIASFEAAASKSELCITTLQSANSELIEKVAELDSFIRSIQSEKEAIEKKIDIVNVQIQEMSVQVTAMFGVEFSSSVDTFDSFKLKIEEIMTENVGLRSKEKMLNERCTILEEENKLKQEKLLKLINEVSNNEKETLVSRQEFESMRIEREVALTAKTILEQEVVSLRQKFSTNHEEWLTAKKEVDSKEIAITQIHSKINELKLEITNNDAKFAFFLNEAANLLSDDFHRVEANEAVVKEKIQQLMTTSKERGAMIMDLEAKLREATSVLSNEINLSKELGLKYESAQKKIAELQVSMRDLEDNLEQSIIIRDHLSIQQSKFLNFFETLSNSFKIKKVSFESTVELDSNLKILLSRIEHSFKKEIEAIEKKQKVSSQKKVSLEESESRVSLLSEEVRSKEVHLELLRKKLVELEELRFGRSELKSQFEELEIENKKLNVKIERLNEQLNKFKCENVHLKSQILDINALKSSNFDRVQEINVMRLKIDELSSLNERQIIKIGELKEENDEANVEVVKTRSLSDNSIQALSQELRGLRLELEKSRSREKQLLEFRAMIAKNFGLDMSSLNLADYQIAAKIEEYLTTIRLPGAINSQIQVQQSPDHFNICASSHSLHHHHHHSHHVCPNCQKT